jgi:hypothetical protein
MEISKRKSLCNYLKQTKMSFFKNEGQDGKTVPFWGWYQWEGGEYKQRVTKGEFHGNIFLCMKMEK